MSLLMCHLLREISPDVVTSENIPPATIISYLNTVGVFFIAFITIYTYLLYILLVFLSVSHLYSGGVTPCLPGTSLYP